MRNKCKTERVREIILNLDHGAIIPTRIQNKLCPTLIDTGATMSCISENFFNSLEGVQLLEIYGLRVISTSGEAINVKGMAPISFTIDKTPFIHTFIICKNVKQPFILGLDFLRRYRISTTWTDEGKFSLQYKNEVLINSIKEFFSEDKPQLKTKSWIEIPGRTLVVIHGRVIIAPEHCERLYNIQPTEEMANNYPELVTVLLVHKTAQTTYNTVPHVLINLGEEEIVLPKGIAIAELHLTKHSVSQITTESCYNISEINKKEIAEELITTSTKGAGQESVGKDDMEKLEKKFITSPADIQEHRKAELQDAIITEEERLQFKQLCEEFPEIFSKSSEDIGRTPLITMDIETGDNPPHMSKTI